MLVNSKKMLKKAKKENKVIFQFNINNLEWAKCILEECNYLKIPVILGASESAIKYMGGYDVVASICFSLIQDLEIKTDVCLHLDHASSVESCQKAIDAGFNSVMIDASKLSLEENIKITKEVVNYARNNSVSVESEIGSMGELKNGEVEFGTNTNLEDAIYFAKETGIDSIAASVGTVHGAYTGKLNIDYKLIESLAKNIEIPLVLHGGSGLDNSILKKCKDAGITKININSDIQESWSLAIRNYLNENNSVIDPRKIIGSGFTAIKSVVEQKNNINN